MASLFWLDWLVPHVPTTADDLSTLFDPIMDFSFGYFSKARILKLTEDLGFVGTQLVRSERPAALAHRPSNVLILTALDLAGLDASGQKPNGHFDKQTNRAVYRLDPRTSGLELRPDPRPDARTDRTEACLSRPTRQAKTDGQVRTNLAGANSDSDHGFSLLARLARTACTDDRADDLSTLFNPIKEFSFGYFSKATILKLSEDLGFVGTQLVRSERPAALADRPAYVLILTALDLAELVLFLGKSYQATVRDSSFGGLVSHIKHPLKLGILKVNPHPS
ncbi:hypothetical protein F2Q69_00013066 [Brassica cretica]|uniref:Uncharacterized protein n=1 Tax=Brassica cretica TaxID=69181 RepID=A0A8S9QZ21_BRACR|nr:hypothetical protein F2Q69_00013066 [Brassica cretica]